MLINLESDNCLEGVQFMSVEKDMYYANDIQAKAEIIEIPFSFKPNRDENNRMVFQIWMPSEQYLTDAEFDAEFQQYIKDNINTVRFDQKPGKRR